MTAEALLFVFMWLSFLVLWFLLLWTYTRSVFSITMPNILLASMILFQFIGLVFLFFQLDQYRASEVTDQVILLKVVGYTGICITFLIFGFSLARRMTGYLDDADHERPMVAASFLAASKLEHAIMLFLGIISTFVLYRYFAVVGLENVVILNALNLVGSGNSDLTALRSAMSNNFEGDFYWYDLFMRKYLTFYSVFLYLNFLGSSKKHWALILFIAFFLITLSSLASTGEKAPVLLFIASLFVAREYVKNNGRTDGKKIFAVFGALMLVASIFYIFLMNIDNVYLGLLSTLSRAFTGSLEPAYHYLELFPSEIGFLHGSSFPNPKGIFPIESFLLTYEVWNRVHPEYYALGLQGSMPAAFWAEAYANFGPIGVVVVSILVGIYVYVLNYFLVRVKSRALTVALIVFSIFHFRSLAETNFSQYLMDTTFAFFVFVTLTALTVLHKGRIRLRHSQSQPRPSRQDYFPQKGQ